MLMRTRRFLAASLLGCALALWVLPGSLDPAMAQQQPPLDPSPALAEPTPSPLPTTTPTPVPTLTLPQFSIEQWVALLLPVVGALMVAAIKPWRERFLRWFDRLTGGEKHDLEEELRLKKAKEQLEAEQKATEARRQRHTARDVYLSHLEQEMRRLAKIPALGREQRELGLEQVYVPLYVVEREQMESFDAYTRGRFGDQGADAARQDAYQSVRESRPVFRLLSEPDQLPPPPPQSAVIVRRPGERSTPRPPEMTTQRLLLVGRAGSGKTTTLHYGALILARSARNDDMAAVRQELQLFTAQRLFPIYARLTEVMTYVHEQYAQRRAELVGAPAQLLLDALDELACRDLPNLPVGMISHQIKEGGCLVMLDGLDETGDADERGSAMDLIANLVRVCPGNRYLVASRPFEGVDERLAGFVERHLRPLDADDIRRLLNRLFRALRLVVVDAGTPTQPSDPDILVPEAAELWRNLERSPRLFDMATNPLLLISMAVLVEGREPLPVERAKIYERLVRLTIEAWRRAQLKRDVPGRVVKIFEESDDSVRLRLQLLAADMLETEGREITLARARNLLRPVYRANNPDWNDERCDDYIRDLLNQIALHSGLLQARNSEALFSFAHFTLQEYLVARHYTEQRSGKETKVAALVGHWPDSRWREAILLAIGHEATSGSREMAQQILNRLLAAGEPEALLLASDGLDEANARAVGELGPQRLAVCVRLRELAALSEEWREVAHPDPVVRNRAATMLDRLDADVERPGLDLSKADYWATRIEPGPFSMGDDNGAYADEKPQFDYTIRRPYALGRFPVTNRQYLLFIEALAGRGTVAAIESARNLLPLMAQHEQTPEQFHPGFWPGARYWAGEGNHPVVGVTWYAATAFAWWANETFLTPEQRANGEAVRLPTEAEWERAAAYPRVFLDDDSRDVRSTYPWGDDVTEEIDEWMVLGIEVNIDKSRIGGTSVVGIFPHGSAACGADDLVGNVREWCSTPPVNYPFESEVIAESLYTTKASSTYVLRGGSWHTNHYFARCTYRIGYDPSSISDLYGFRLVRLFSCSSS